MKQIPQGLILPANLRARLSVLLTTRPGQRLQSILSKVDLSRLITVVMAFLAFIMYQQGTAPSVATIFDDSLEFPLVVHRLAIAHPTGYPLYILLGKLFSLFNRANVAYQVNLMSAVFGALTVALVYQIGLALWSKIRPGLPPGPVHHAGSALAAVLFGVGPVFFSQATIAEVYTLNAFFVAIILLLSLRQRWLWLAFWLGLSLTHHRTIVLIFPPVTAFIGWQSLIQPTLSAERRPSLFKLGLAFAGPWLLYLYLPLRGHIGSLDGTYQATWSGFWSHILGGGYSVFLVDHPFGNERSLAFYWHLVSQELNAWGVGLAILGLLLLIIRRQGRLLLLTGLTFLVYLTFNLFYAVTDIAVFFIPLFLLLALWAGLAMSAILAILWLRQPLVAGIVAIAVFIFLVTQQRGQSRANDWAVHDYGRDILSQPLPEKAAVVGILGEMTLLRYFQETAGLRPDIQTVAADLEVDRLGQVRQLLEDSPEQAVYLTRELSSAAERWSLSAQGPLISVNAAPRQHKPPLAPDLTIQQDVALSLSPEVKMTRYAITRPASHQPIPPVRLTILWHVEAEPDADYKISARLLDPRGEVVAVVDQVPVHFAYPTTAWRAGEFIADVYDLALPPNMSPGEYTPLFILYDPANGAAELGRITLPATYIQ